ncbi:single-stranded DNA-binding protein [Kitasatospora aureofaciens]|uniref:single-stranded DNA-binding protein n=1 Tax=Kitasatospora aureofaciens TaxID=1894 RepID=UPI001C461FC2|nr:single-stranded DNA-binding protein [Kitasatospora aureofaciens]MBV6697633.1 single-stranded DNA-binding protein [Kitasatospora aureofaciens]
MNETQVTVIGNVATEVTYGETGSGVPMASFRLASTERRYDRQRECWVDGDTQWLSVTAWRALAVNLIGSLAKGDPVVVSGRLRMREWGEGEVKRAKVEIDARWVGHDLTRGTSAFRWASGARGHPSTGAGAVGGEPGGQGDGEAVPGWIADALAARKASALASGSGPGESGVEPAGVAAGAAVASGEGDGVSGKGSGGGAQAALI